MDPLFSVLLGVGGVLAVVIFKIVGDRQARRAYAEAAQALGFAHLPGQLGSRRERMEGEINGVHLDVRTANRRRGKDKTLITRFEATAPGIPVSLKLSKESLGTTLGRMVGISDVEIGDPDFDHAVLVKGPSLVLSAALDARTREMIQQQITTAGLVVEGGAVVMESSERLKRADLIVGRARAISHVAGRLVINGGEIPGRLRRNVEGDPFPGIRSHCLSLLMTHYPDDPQTRLAAAAAMSDADAAVRLLGAQASGAEGRAVLWAIATQVGAEDIHRASALASWLALAPPEEAAPQIVALLQQLGPQVKHHPRLAGVLFEASQDASALPLLERLAEHVDAQSSEALARALARLGLPQQSCPALARLLRIEDLQTRLIASEALGRLGDHRAISPLNACTQGLLTDGRLKALAKAAIEQIEAREGPAQFGGLSIAESDGREGALSMDERGKLSPATPQRRSEPEG